MAAEYPCSIVGLPWLGLAIVRFWLQTVVELMPASSSVNITELIDRYPLGRFQIRIIVLCGLVALLDGFDLLAIGVAAPAMAGPLHIAPNHVGLLFSAALFGLMLGAFALGPIADRYGRRCVLIGATATFGVFTLCTASAATLQQILLFRFLAGVGFGGAMPSFISLAAEYTPRSNRQAVIGLLWTGVPLGGVMIGLLGARLIDAVGWQWLFYIGGILPLVLSTVMIRALPDSIEFLVMREAARRDIRDLLIRISPTFNIASGCQFVINDEETRGEPVWQLFSAGRACGTVLLWASYFVTFMMVATSGAWTPTLLQRAGISGAQSSVAKIGDSFVALGPPALCAALFTSLIGINRPRGSGLEFRRQRTSQCLVEHEQNSNRIR
jgi:MFS transporter, AAHS family, 4-hydroxybenzoate transporter